MLCLNKANAELRKRMSRLNETNVEVERQMSWLNKWSIDFAKRGLYVKMTNKLNFDRKTMSYRPGY